MGDQPLQHPGERARMHVEDRGEIAGGDAREQPDDPQDQALRPGHAQIAAMPFELRSRPWTTAHSSCMKSSTSGSASLRPGSTEGFLFAVIDAMRRERGRRERPPQASIIADTS